ncbi:transcriptional regulator [Ornatilinea apprima]|uniref:Segregation and condensation protein B n=1 Tax=Ornatilinea apprima TaxID=1134406 RepID=A0A0P6XHF2_9CHLR|nr:SMC-Scp complex subunit ScpB [Ornatilinea apprima]KPL74332.1 transcriptional regulator [Ornatilinea apprima]
MSEQAQYSHLSQSDIRNAIEALLYVAAGPVSPGQLAETLAIKVKEAEEQLKALEVEYQAQRGLRLQWHAGRVQITTAPEYADLVEKFLGLDATQKLSRAALETLAIIAYRQPVTRPGVDAIRGVNSDGVMRSLLSKGLVEEVGRADGPGRPILYGTTADFLQYFGLGSLGELPPFEEETAEETPKGNGLLKD